MTDLELVFKPMRELVDVIATAGGLDGLPDHIRARLAVLTLTRDIVVLDGEVPRTSDEFLAILATIRCWARSRGLSLPIMS